MSRRDQQQNILDFGALGSYRQAVVFALVANQAANGTLVSLRWTDATRLLVLEHAEIRILQGAAATATIQSDLRLFRCTNFTASDSAGTALTPQPKRSSMGASLVGDFRQTAAAAGLTVGTRTADAMPFLALSFQQTITNPNQNDYSAKYDAAQDGATHPIVLAQNEGLILRNTTGFGATGTASAVLVLDWTEVDAF